MKGGGCSVDWKVGWPVGRSFVAVVVSTWRKGHSKVSFFLLFENTSWSWFWSLPGGCGFASKRSPGFLSFHRFLDKVFGTNI